MLLAFAGLKGGTGKTTLAVALASESLRRGRRTLLLDADPRADALSWATGSTRAPTTLACDTSWDASVLSAVARGHEVVCLDLPTGSERMLELAPAVDLVVIPCGPSPLDVWGAVDTADLLPDSRTLVLPSRVNPRGKLSESLHRDLAATGASVCATRIGRRVLHEEAMAAHDAVPRYAPRSRAAAEVAELLDEFDRRRPAYESVAWAQ